MTMTVIEAITRVRNYIDDASSNRWTKDEVKLSLETALDLLVAEAVQGGVHQSFRLSTTSTLSGGTITVPEHFKIISVFYSNSNIKTAIQPGGARNRNFVDLATSGTIELDYIAKNNVNWSNDNDNVTYGTVDIKNTLWDAYLCTLASLDLLVKEGEAAGILQDRAQRYRTSVLQTPTTGQIQVFPQSRNILNPSTYYQLYYYEKTPTQLEVYR